MRRFLPLLVFLVWVSPAKATPRLFVEANPLIGQAPLEVTLTASGDGIAYHWELGDGAQGDGSVVQHRYEAGRYVAKVTATGADGTTAQAQIVITSLRLTLTGPRVATYGRTATFQGRLFPAIRHASLSLQAGETAVAATKTNKAGRFRVRVRPGAPASYTVRFGGVVSNAVAVPLRPGLDVALPRAAMVGRRLVLRVDLRPRGSGTVKVRIWRRGRELRPRTFEDVVRLRLDTRRVGNYVVRIAVTPKGAFSGRATTLHSSVYLPYLSLGSRGPSVRILEQRLRELHYALRGVDGYYAYDTADAVTAFQKVNGLSRTGHVTPAVWRRLQSAHVPWPRYRGGHHIEVDKSRQVLFEVKGGQVVRVVQVSTGATGNTPVGRWHVYSKVPGTLPTGMFYSSFFLRGFAIHGYPSVPPYPASHGCVRIPMWIAPSLFASNSYGEAIYVY